MNTYRKNGSLKACKGVGVQVDRVVVCGCPVELHSFLKVEEMCFCQSGNDECGQGQYLLHSPPSLFDIAMEGRAMVQCTYQHRLRDGFYGKDFRELCHKHQD